MNNKFVQYNLAIALVLSCVYLQYNGMSSTVCIVPILEAKVKFGKERLNHHNINNYTLVWWW